MRLDKVATKIAGCYELKPRMLADERGAFVKTFNADWFRELGLRADWTEQYYSLSKKRVLRGLHFQVPPHQHAKLVYCTLGEVFDVAVDLRVGSPSFGDYVGVVLSATFKTPPPVCCPESRSGRPSPFTSAAVIPLDSMSP